MSSMVDAYLRDHEVEKKFSAFSEHYLPPVGDCLLARAENGDAEGVVMLTKKSDVHCEMNRMFVPERARGSGLGRVLCMGILERAREMGFVEMTLDTVDHFKSAIALYESVGFEFDNRPDRYGADDPRVVNMRISLGAQSAN